MRPETAAFARMMDAEMDANEARKGESWRVLSSDDLYFELNKHADKLRLAMLAGDADKIAEHAADVGNCARFIAERAGVLSKHYRGSDPGADWY